VHAELTRAGWHCGRKRVARLMRAHHLVGVHARRRWRTARTGMAVAGVDLVRRNFNPTGPNQLWAADVTQFRTGEGWLYLAAVLDLWSRRVIGWAIGPAVDAELVGDALLMAFQRRRPDRRVVHHSDRGAVYTSLAFSARLTALELDQRSAPSAAATTTPPSSRSSPPSNANSPGSTTTRSGRPALSCEPRSSTTSRPSTTPNAFNGVSAIEAP
jgi:transposase InsO family protein